ncbi:MAG: hypothetical protein WCA84_05855 [Ignavibacteriaceae bacterium]
MISSETKFTGMLILVIVQFHYYQLFAAQVPAQTSVKYLSFVYYQIQMMEVALEKELNDKRGITHAYGEVCEE